MTFSILGYCVQAVTLPVEEATVISQSVKKLGDGLTLVTTIYETTSTLSAISPLATSYTKTNTKTQEVKSDTDTLFTFSVTGKFTVNPGVSATCTSSTYSYNISNSAWSLDTASASKSSNKAMASGTFIKKLLFIKVDELTLNLTLTCDINGNVS